jgi:hypothetical protein
VGLNAGRFRALTTSSTGSSTTPSIGSLAHCDLQSNTLSDETLTALQRKPHCAGSNSWPVPRELDLMSFWQAVFSKSLRRIHAEHKLTRCCRGFPQSVGAAVMVDR